MLMGPWDSANPQVAGLVTSYAPLQVKHFNQNSSMNYSLASILSSARTILSFDVLLFGANQRIAAMRSLVPPWPTNLPDPTTSNIPEPCTYWESPTFPCLKLLPKCRHGSCRPSDPALCWLQAAGVFCSTWGFLCTVGRLWSHYCSISPG